MELPETGHVAPGLYFCIIGLWHMFNHTKLHTTNPKSYSFMPWFPVSKSRYIELYFTMLASSLFISIQFFFVPRHRFFTIHLHNLEHAAIGISIFTYAFFAILLDKLRLPANCGLTNMLYGLMFAQELFLFYVHSADHVGLEGQYHWLLQVVLMASLAITLLSFRNSSCFLLGFIRSLAIFSQGVWLILIGFMIYVPRLIPEGCIWTSMDGRRVLQCHGEDVLRRAKSIVNVMFSLYVTLMSIFGVLFYSALVKLCVEKVDKYENLMLQEDGRRDEDGYLIEKVKGSISSNSF